MSELAAVIASIASANKKSVISSLRQRLSRLLSRSALLAFALGIPAAIDAGDLPPSDAEIASVGRKYGAPAAIRVQQWRAIMASDKGTDDARKLDLVNRFFNALPFVSDAEHWGKTDYWATPLEFLQSNGGDCEDFAIAKYLTLRELGVPIERLRITYVNAIALNQAHMVLAYYATPDAVPLVLDNLQPAILPASRRSDLVPVYSFNGDSLWLARELAGRGRLVGGAGRINLWRGLMERLQQEKQD
jgi:predicted transglutaminase-like cysteine proteinase